MPTAEQALAAIDDACDEAALHSGVQQATAILAAEFRSHTPVFELGARLGDMQRRAVAAAVRLVPGTAGLAWTWFVSGSVARGEPAPGSDVESLLAIGDSVDDEGKAVMLARAADVHGLLERCGIGGDANGVLASRPRFCRRMRSWSEGVAKWTADPRQDRGVVMTGLMSDSTAVFSTLDVPEDALRTLTLAAFSASSPASQALLQDATTLRAHFPSRLKTFATQSDSVDLKLAAIDPVVKIARWAALSAGSKETSTSRRIADAAAAGSLDTDDATSLQECYAWLGRFRWQIRIGCFTDRRPGSDLVSLTALAPQERAALRSVAREIAGISRKLRYLSSFA